MSNIEKIKNYKRKAWNTTENAEKYDINIYRNRFNIKIKNKVEFFYVKKYAKGKILDAGAGTGRFSLFMLDNGSEVYSSDISHPMLSIAKKKNNKVKAVVADIFNLPFTDNYFDSIVSITVLEHFIDYEKILKEFCRVLKPGGTIIFEMPNKNNHVLNSSSDNCESIFYSMITVKQMRKLVNKYSLEIIKYYPYDFFNQNQLLKKLFLHDRIYILIINILNVVFKFPGLIRLWYYIEIYILKYFPDFLCFNIIYIIRKK